MKLRIRFSLDNLKHDGDLLNIPLFLADQTDQLINLALKDKIWTKKNTSLNKEFREVSLF